MKTNLIQWPRAKYWDKPWNPIIGCKPCSPACDNCYARALVTGRFNTTGICAPGFAPTETKRVNPPRTGVVFCGNLTDLFGPWVAERFCRSGEYVERTLGAVGMATYLWLTKRPGAMCDVLNHHEIVYDDFGDCFRRSDMTNQFFGFTAEDQKRFDERRDAIYHEAPTWANLWLSCEPLLGEIESLFLGNFVAGNKAKWVVVGCESGPRRRPCRIEWVESIVEECQHYGVPVFVKQLDLGGKCVTDINKFPKHLRIRQVPWNRADGKEAK